MAGATGSCDLVGKDEEEVFEEEVGTRVEGGGALMTSGDDSGNEISRSEYGSFFVIPFLDVEECVGSSDT